MKGKSKWKYGSLGLDFGRELKLTLKCELFSVKVRKKLCFQGQARDTEIRSNLVQRID